MKIVIITNIPSPYRVDFFNYLMDNSGFEYHVVYASRNEGNREWKVDPSTLRNSTFLAAKTITIKKKTDNRYIHITTGVGGVLNKLNPDVVIASEYNITVLQALLWSKRNRKKFVSWTDGTLNSEKNIGILQSLARKYVIRSSDAYIGSSSASRQTQIAYGANPDKCFTSFLTVDIDKFRQKREKAAGNTIIFVGQLILRKGVDLLFAALQKVRVEWRLIVVGNGPDLHKLMELADQMGLGCKIEFCGFLPQEKLLEKYAQSDLFILPTREDCFGLVILEAMCSGLPLIVSKFADGAGDLVEDGKNGFIVDPYDSEQLAEKIEQVLIDKEVAEQMGCYSEEKCKGFSFESVSIGFVAAADFAINS